MKRPSWYFKVGDKLQLGPGGPYAKVLEVIEGTDSVLIQIQHPSDIKPAQGGVLPALEKPKSPKRRR
jgi:hypothetical protein